MTTTATTTQPTFEVANIAERYTAIWGEQDPANRRAAVMDLWTDDGVEYVEGVQFRGHAELTDRVAYAYGEFAGSGKYRVVHANDAARHADLVTFTIQLVDAATDALAWAARVFLIVDDSGRVREDYQLTVHPFSA